MKKMNEEVKAGILILVGFIILFFIIIAVVNFYIFITSGTWRANLTIVAIIGIPILALYLGRKIVSIFTYIPETKEPEKIIVLKEPEKTNQPKEILPPIKPSISRRPSTHLANEERWAREAKNAIDNSICRYCKQPASDLDSGGMCSDCYFAFID